MLYRGNAAYGCNAASCAIYMAAMPQRLPYMAAMPRHGGNAATWRQCRDMAAMPRHVLHPVHRGNAAANDRRSHVYARMHTCTHVLSFVCTHEKPNTTAAMMARMRMRSQSQWARIITLSARLPITLSAPPNHDRRIHVYARMHTCTHVLSFLCTHEKPNTTAARIAAARICC